MRIQVRQGVPRRLDISYHPEFGHCLLEKVLFLPPIIRDRFG
jgi:hypothetical protein